MIRNVFFADLEKPGIADQPGIIFVGGHAGRININNFLYIRQSIFNFEELIDLFLILNNHKRRRNAINGKSQFIGNRGRE